MPKIGLSIVGKERIVRESVARVLSDSTQFEILAEVSAIEELVETCQKKEPFIILICCGLPDCGGINAIQFIHEKLPRSYIVFIGDGVTNDELLIGITMGVRAYLSRDISIRRMVNVIDLVAEGKLILSPHMAGQVALAIESLPAYSSKFHIEGITVLSRREKMVIEQVKNGLTNKEIATALGISEHTVKVHMLNIMQKLHAHNRQQAVSIFNKTQLLWHAPTKDTTS